MKSKHTLAIYLLPLRQIRITFGRYRATECAIAVMFAVTAFGAAPVYGGTLTCLTGSDTQTVANDSAQIGSVRALVDTACPCANFDGSSTAKTHGAYVSCANAIIKGEANAGRLRKQCKGAVKRYYKKSTCGFSASLDKVVCIKKTTPGKVSCAIKSSARCVDVTGKYTQAACTDFTLCIDAADSNTDGRITADDAGTCGCAPGSADCNSDAADGCEVNLQADPDHCGSCANDCSVSCSGNVSTTACSSGACVIASCNAGFYDIDHACTNGCECHRYGVADTSCVVPRALGTVTPGGMVTYTENQPGSGDQSWYQVTFTTGGTPKVQLSTNPGGQFAFDLLQTCASAPLCSNSTSCTPGPGTYLVKVKRVTGPPTCDNYVLRVSN